MKPAGDGFRPKPELQPVISMLQLQPTLLPFASWLEVRNEQVVFQTLNAHMLISSRKLCLSGVFDQKPILGVTMHLPISLGDLPC